MKFIVRSNEVADICKVFGAAIQRSRMINTQVIAILLLLVSAIILRRK